MKKYIDSYLLHQIPVFPCRNEDKKKPAIKKGFYAASLNEDQIEAWRNKYDYFAFAVGEKSGVAVIDVDSHKTRFRQGNVPEDLLKQGFQITTASGGTHYLFKWTEALKGISSGQDLGTSQGIDWRIDRGYACIHEELPENLELNPVPEGLIKLLKGKSEELSKEEKAEEIDKTYRELKLLLANINSDMGRTRWLFVLTCIKIIRNTDKYKKLAWDWSNTSKWEHSKQVTESDFESQWNSAKLTFTSQANAWRILKKYSKSNRKTLELIDIATITPKRTEWLVPDWIPKGEITTITGETSTGKSRLALKFIIMNARKDAFLCGGKGDGRPSIYWSDENSIEKFVSPVSLAYGAQEGDIHVVGSVTEDSESRYFNVAKDLETLCRKVETGEYATVTLDPLYAIAQELKNSHDSMLVRSLLEELTQTAQKTNTAFIGIMHPNKDWKDKVLASQTSGAAAWVNVPRMGLMVRNGITYDDNGVNKPCSILFKQQGNLCKTLDNGMLYIIEDMPVHGHNMTIGGCKFRKYLEVSRAEIVKDWCKGTAVSEGKKADPYKYHKEAFKNILDSEQGNMRVEEFNNVVKDQVDNISDKTIYRIRKEMGIKSFKINDEWYVSLNTPDEYKEIEDDERELPF